MKKILTLLLCVFSFTLIHAQDDVDLDEDQAYKQNSGEKSLELQFDPGAIFNASNTNNVLSNGLGVRLRIFSSTTFAYRLSANISYVNNSTLTQEADGAAGLEELRNKTSNLGVDLRPGIEIHFEGTKRLSPYVGAELALGYQSLTTKNEYQAGTEVYVQKVKNAGANDGITAGLAAVAGADFYIAKKLYLGLELNYGVYYTMPSKSVTSDTAPNTTNVETKLGKTNTLVFAPQALGVLRIGFLF